MPQSLPLSIPLRAAGALLFTVPFAIAQEALPDDRAKGAATVDVAQCKQWLGTLASPEFEGRGTGQPGYQKAADYVAAHFKALGLEARGDNGTYFQAIPWESTIIDAKNTSVTFANGEHELRIPSERLSGSATTKMSAAGDVVLLVCAAPLPAAGADDSRFTLQEIPGLDAIPADAIAGKVVVICVRTTDETRRNAPMARFAVQAALQGKNAAGVLFAQDEAPTRGLRGGRSGRPDRAPGMAGGRQLPLNATFGGDDLQALLKMAGKDASVLAAGDAATLVPLPVKANVEIAVAQEAAPAMNVWGVLPGSDPQKKDEYVVIGSHLDHLGRRGDTTFPGADDDASGTTGVMAAAQMFAKNGKRPARSVLFVCFVAEENGLQGSAHFADNCPVPITSIVAELQMDMIGRDEEEALDGGGPVNVGEKAEDNRNSLHLVGTERLSPELHQLCLQRNDVAKFDLEFDQESLYGRSDHYNFAKKGVPVAFFFTGLHRDYHQPTDTPDKIHYEKLLRVATYVYDIGFELASRAERPAVDPELLKKETSTGGRRQRQRPTGSGGAEPR